MEKAFFIRGNKYRPTCCGKRQRKYILQNPTLPPGISELSKRLDEQNITIPNSQQNVVVVGSRDKELAFMPDIHRPPFKTPKKGTKYFDLTLTPNT